MRTKLAHFTQKAREEPRERFHSLMGLLFDPEGLRASFGRQVKSKAPGVDGMRKAEYAEGLEDRLRDLSGRLRRLGYRPKPVRRAYIPKGGGRYRLTRRNAACALLMGRNPYEHSKNSGSQMACNI